ncbi:MAG: hypothetical protein HWN67_02980 [Candidatus Helarchaeota archaeon]|nr:hypothetical protein [Candidatus Helarchaeota archaeon]
MNIRNFPRYWYHRKILKGSDEKTEDIAPKELEMKPQIGKADPGPIKKSKVT